MCPKCGREGKQYIVYDKADHKRAYLRYEHAKNDVCYIGRIRSGGGGMGEFNKPQSLEEYKKAMTDIAKQIRSLVDYYSPDSATRWKSIAPKLLGIVEEYGY